MRIGRPLTACLLPILLALLAFVLFLIVPALTGSEDPGRRVPGRMASRR